MPTNSAFAPSAGRFKVIEIPIRPPVVTFPPTTPKYGGCASPKPLEPAAAVEPASATALTKAT